MEEDFNIDEDYIKKLSEKYKNVDHPLFMSELPKNIEENEDLEALYNLMISDENPISLAKNYKEVGNDYFKDGVKYYEDAIISYNKGIDILNSYINSINNDKLKKQNNLNHVTNKKYNNDEQIKLINENNCNNGCILDKDSNTMNEKKLKEECENNFITTNVSNNTNKNEAINLLSDIYCNKSIIHYKKKRYVKCLDDCKKALSYNNKKYKCLYFCALCSYHMELYNDAYKYIKIFDDLIKDENIRSLININDYEKLKNQILEKYENFLHRKKIKEDEKKIIIEKQKNEMNKIENILRKRDITILENIYNNDNITPVLYLDENRYIHFTVFLIYFETNFIDTILDFAENTRIIDYFDIIKKNKENELLFCYLEFPDDKFYFINKYSYICDIINKIKLFTPIISLHIIENADANNTFKSNKNIFFIEE
ncbi:conserved Plasmodium protein, unknown function [Plasmodium gallinaceum]|uniref:Tetratricopeptide repeat protein n=1 Tax=Plasmodium gallinaceum TaxID=5849 RepID=A0A1J1GYR1_PLAGA|nr:conserved Plasmodium protein, unknown function [Plasmodium gallinaceum]CRG96147.1 conserved Plasmodium protein, unknown function [Plasmodium gallinaceum]